LPTQGTMSFSHEEPNQIDDEAAERAGRSEACARRC